MSEKTAKTVRSMGHQTSGGHSVRTPSPTKAGNSSALSRANRIRWDVSDGYTGDPMPYQYQEYPKHVYPDPDHPKKHVVVRSTEEERIALGGDEVISDEDERKRLLTLAAVKEVVVDKRWGPAKIIKAIEDAGFDPTADPFK